MAKADIMEAIDRLNFAIKKVNDFEELDIDLSSRILDNRIITLEGYLRYLESDGIPKIEKIRDILEGDFGDRSDIL